ncbi:MAG TPA: toll/interleukin-1 receptor domain-containing protein [Propionicimonas sp.]|nr:toll/interleukin-1 receptor domain-containing protein [Propionicimonas sp.]
MASDTWVRQKQQGPAMGVDPREVSPTHLADAVATSGWDVFISHASEDKDDIARPLAEALQARGVSVWFDELNIAWGQPIHRAIEAGIANGTYGLVIISPTFMVKQWTQAELDALHGRQMGRPDGHGLILPLWHRVTTDDVQQNLPMIAALKALNTAVLSVEQIADEAAKLVFASR